MVAPAIATGAAEAVPLRGIGGRQLGHLAVRGAAVARAEDVDRARVNVLALGSDNDGVAINGHGVAEPVARRGVGGRQLGHLAVCGAAVGRAEDVGLASSAGLPLICPNYDGVAVDRHGDTELVVARGVGGRQLVNLHVVKSCQPPPIRGRLHHEAAQQESAAHLWLAAPSWTAAAPRDLSKTGHDLFATCRSGRRRCAAQIIVGCAVSRSAQIILALVSRTPSSPPPVHK